MSLPSGYSFRELDKDEFQRLQQPLAKKIFEETSPIFNASQAIPEAELEQWRALGKNMGDLYTLRLGLFHREEFVGWHFGIQQSGEKFYMQNSAVATEHRRKGLYRALLNEVLARAKAKGFQVIYSRHMAMNNAVIIPKLKAGFVITAMELSDVFGLLVHLSFYTNPLRRKVLEFRTGETFPDEEIRKHLRF